ncbi:MAG: FHA domain-containing protein [Anaerolineales bacterium]|nr:FHA domain-containing protein [Anaerolineales bacterium]
MAEDSWIECPACGQKHRPGTLFCSECGVYLPTGGPVGTERFSIGEGLGIGAELLTRDVAAGESSPPTLRLKLLDTGRVIHLPAAAEVLIGRIDPAMDAFPDVDLMPDGGLEGGVSRRHCKIERHGAYYFVEDVGSANGTLLNGKRLQAYLPHVLHNGDELQLGRIRLQIIIEEE